MPQAEQLSAFSSETLLCAASGAPTRGSCRPQPPELRLSLAGWQALIYIRLRNVPAPPWSQLPPRCSTPPVGHTPQCSPVPSPSAQRPLEVTERQRLPLAF